MVVLIIKCDCAKVAVAVKMMSTMICCNSVIIMVVMVQTLTVVL